MFLKKKRSGAVAVEYIMVFPMFILVLILLSMLFILTLNIMKYNDIATETANNAAFSSVTTLPPSSTCLNTTGSIDDASIQCSYYIDNNYDERYLYNSPYVILEKIETIQINGTGPTTRVKDGILIYINIHYKMFGFDFISSGMSVIF